MAIGNWVRGWKRSQTPKTIRRPRLGMENLEDRTTPATFSQSGGLLTISMTGATDALTISGLIAGGTSIGMNGTGISNQSATGVTAITINNTSGVAGTQAVRFQDTTGRITLTGALIINSVHTVDFNNPVSPLTANGGITITGGRFITQQLSSIQQLVGGGTVTLSAAGTGDAIGSASNPIRIAGNSVSLSSITTAGNGNQYLDFGGIASFVNVTGAGKAIDAGSGTVTLTNGSFFGSGFGDAFGNSTVFNLGTGGGLGVGNNETIGGLSGTGTVAIAEVFSGQTNTLLVGGGNSSTSFSGTIKDIDPNISVGSGGKLALAKTGTGTFTLNGANTFTGGTTVNGGTLRVIGTGAANRLANNSLVTVNSSGIFEIADTNPIPTVANSIDVTLNGGILQLSGASNSGDHIRNLTFNNGGTVRNSGTLSSFGNTNLAVNGTITVSGSSSTPASIDLPNGIAIANTTFSVADITGNANPDLVFSATTGLREVGLTATLTKTGAGTLVLGADNTYTGTTTISAGTLQLGNGGTTGSLGAGNIVNNGTLTVNRSNSITQGNAISGSGRLVKLGAGLLTLTNASSYSGGTTISNGQIQFSNSTALGAGTVTLVDANTVTGSNPTLLSTGAADLTVANNIVVGSTGQVGFIGSSGAATGSVNYTGTITLNQTMFILAGTSSSSGTRYTGRITGNGGVTVQGQTATSLAILDNPAATNDFTGSVLIADVILQLTQNSSAGQIPDTARVNFATAGSTLRLFLIDETIAALNTAAGIGVVEATGSGTSTLTVGGGNTSGTFGGILRNGSNGVLQLVKTGTGTQTLTGNNTYTGTTTVSGGTLLVNGTIANGSAATDVTTSGSGVIGGFGTIQGVTVVTSGGSLLPGDTNTVGTLNTGNVTFNSGSFFGVKLTGFVVGDSLNVTGTVNLGGATLFAIDSLAALGTFTIINNDGTDPIVGTFAGLPEGATFHGDNGKPFLITYRGGDGNDVVLTPETLPTRLLATGPGNGGGVLLNVTTGSTYGSPTNVSLIPGFGGEIRVARVDVNGDGTRDLVAGSGPGGSRIRILNGNDNTTVIADFNAFPGFAGGVYVAGGDFNGDGFEELVVTGDGADAFSGPVANGLGVRIYSGATLTGSNPPVLASFNGLASLSGAQGEGAAVRLGGRPAVADVNGDARPDLLIAAGNGGGPRVVIWPGQAFLTTSNGQPPVNPIANLFVFEPTQRGGAFLTAGDLNGDSFADIAVGGGPGGGPRVRTVNSRLMLGLPNLEAVNLDDPVNLANGLVLNNFFSGDGNNRGGVRVAMRDADLDGLADLVTASGTNEPSQIRIYTDTSVAAVFGTSSEPNSPQVIDPFSALLPGGIWIG
ncbi:MAG: autotransporter-associated beta strand repeat-containing protein [Gemmataceae bacterium]